MYMPLLIQYILRLLSIGSMDLLGWWFISVIPASERLRQRIAASLKLVWAIE